MAIDTATFEATLDSKIDAATTSNDAKEFLLLAKAVEATNNAVSSSSLAVSNNLSDVANAATALSNLGGAGLASPAFTGTPTAPTATAGTNTTQIATTAFVAGEVAGIVDAAPATLDTLNELAAALGDDANFSTTVTNSIATKLPLAGGTLTGDVTFNANVKALFGGSNDLQIYHDGSNSIISDQGTGDLNIQSSGSMRLQNAAGTQNYLFAADGGAVQLHYAGNVKIATTSTGAAVTGDLSVSGNVSGNYTNLHPEVTSTSAAATSQTFDMNDPMTHMTMTAATTFTAINLAAGKTSMMVLDTTASAYTPSWVSDIKWPDATEPTWSGYRYWIVSFTCLNGTTTLASASGYTV